jgi:hypothetical protein
MSGVYTRTRKERMAGVAREEIGDRRKDEVKHKKKHRLRSFVITPLQTQINANLV